MRSSNLARKPSHDYKAIVDELVRTVPVPKPLEEACWDFRDGFGFAPEALSLLLDKRGWRVERPEIRVTARVNQRGNFVVRWNALREIEFPDRELLDFDYRLIRYSDIALPGERPRNELMWIHNLGLHQINNRNPDLRKLTLSIYSGVVSKYYEILEAIKASLSVRYHTELSIEVDEEEGTVRLIAEPR